MLLHLNTSSHLCNENYPLTHIVVQQDLPLEQNTRYTYFDDGLKENRSSFYALSAGTSGQTFSTTACIICERKKEEITYSYPWQKYWQEKLINHEIMHLLLPTKSCANISIFT